MPNLLTLKENRPIGNSKKYSPVNTGHGSIYLSEKLMTPFSERFLDKCVINALGPGNLRIPLISSSEISIK